MIPPIAQRMVPVEPNRQNCPSFRTLDKIVRPLIRVAEAVSALFLRVIRKLLPCLWRPIEAAGISLLRLAERLGGQRGIQERLRMQDLCNANDELGRRLAHLEIDRQNLEQRLELVAGDWVRIKEQRDEWENYFNAAVERSEQLAAQVRDSLEECHRADARNAVLAVHVEEMEKTCTEQGRQRLAATESAEKAILAQGELRHQVTLLTEARDAVSAERDGALAVRDGLEAARARLQQEKEGLLIEIEGLRAQGDGGLNRNLTPILERLIQRLDQSQGLPAKKIGAEISPFLAALQASRAQALRMLEASMNGLPLESSGRIPLRLWRQVLQEEVKLFPVIEQMVAQLRGAVCQCSELP